MPKFDVEALEKFVVRTFYRGVEAATKEEAECLCREGQVAYDDKEIEEGDEEWLETVEVELSEDQSADEDNSEVELNEDD